MDSGHQALAANALLDLSHPTSTRFVSRTTLSSHFPLFPPAVPDALCFQCWFCVWEVHHRLRAYCVHCILGAGEMAFLKLLLYSTSFVYFSLLFYFFLRQSRFETQADLGHVVTWTSLDFRAFLLPHPPEYCRWLPSDPAGFIYFLPCGIFDLV